MVFRHAWNRTTLRLCISTTFPNAIRLGIGWAVPLRRELAVRTSRLRGSNTAPDLVWLSHGTARRIEQSDFATARSADSATRTECASDCSAGATALTAD